MANPNIPVGTLNRLKVSLVWNDFPALNVTPSFLDKGGIRFSLEGEAVTYLPTMTGAVTSPEPYQKITMEVNLLKTQTLSSAYKAQQEQSALLGDGTIRPDVSSGLTPYAITNCAIEGVEPMSFNGEVAGWTVRIGGYYLINQQLWD